MNDDLILYYASTLILQYRTKEKAPEHIKALIRALMIYDIAEKVSNGFNIDDAIGVQLDVLAKYTGCNRTITGIDFTRTYYSYVSYTASPIPADIVGMIEYTEINPPDAQFLDYTADQQSLFNLNDTELRLLVKMKIIQNNSNYSTSEIDDFVNEFFPDTTIFNDNKNMTIEYIFDEQERRFAQIIIAQKAIPKPAAVGLIVNYVNDINNIFGYLAYDAVSPADFSQGYIDYIDSPFGSYLRY